MTATRRYNFETLQPVELHVEIGQGSVLILAEDTTESTVDLKGPGCGEVVVEQRGRQISVVAPKQRTGFFSNQNRLEVSVTIPLHSDVRVRTGSADVTVEGPIGGALIKSGSGAVQVSDLAGASTIETGSGLVSVGLVKAELRIKSGSGTVKVSHVESAVAVSTGSGDVEIGTNHAPTAVKTGSGDFHVVDAHSDVSMATGSGDLVIGTARRGKLTLKGASSDIRIGIPAGTPVWTDISTISGSIRSDLDGPGQPADGADHIELRAKTVSGDITLSQV